MLKHREVELTIKGLVIGRAAGPSRENACLSLALVRQVHENRGAWIAAHHVRVSTVLVADAEEEAEKTKESVANDYRHDGSYRDPSGADLYPAEDYHQNFHVMNEARYKSTSSAARGRSVLKNLGRAWRPKRRPPLLPSCSPATLRL